MRAIVSVSDMHVDGSVRSPDIFSPTSPSSSAAAGTFGNPAANDGSFTPKSPSSATPTSALNSNRNSLPNSFARRSRIIATLEINPRYTKFPMVLLGNKTDLTEAREVDLMVGSR